MVSGIGPAATLNAYQIPVCANRPGVGQNMWDNTFSGSTYPVNVLTHNSLANPAVIDAAVSQYNSQRTGILTNSGGDFLAFEKLPNGSLSMATRKALDDTYGPDWPDVEYLELDAYFGDQLLPPPVDTIGKNFAALLPGLTAPFSRGNVTIVSNDTSVLPVVSPNWLTDPRDREILIAAFRRARQVWATKSMQGVLTGPEAYPGANVTSDSDLLAAIQRSAQTIWHASATNKMGMPSDSMAVVDSRARVIGVQGLRVVDASAFPFLPPGQPQSMVYALAEKISQHILDGE
jgi:choline dehydrogenase-like flavoprotein